MRSDGVATASSEFRPVTDQIPQTAGVLLFDSLVNTDHRHRSN